MRHMRKTRVAALAAVTLLTAALMCGCARPPTPPPAVSSSATSTVDLRKYDEAVSYLHSIGTTATELPATLRHLSVDGRVMRVESEGRHFVFFTRGESSSAVDSYVYSEDDGDIPQEILADGGRAERISGNWWKVSSDQ